MITIVRVIKRVRMMTDEDEKKDYGVLKTWTCQDHKHAPRNDSHNRCRMASFYVTTVIDNIQP